MTIRRDGPDPDIYRPAKVLIEQHGEEAPIFAAMQADKQAAAGDMEGRGRVAEGNQGD